MACGKGGDPESVARGQGTGGAGHRRQGLTSGSKNAAVFKGALLRRGPAESALSLWLLLTN